MPRGRTGRQQENRALAEEQLQELVDQQAKYMFDPELWARDIVGFIPDTWQAKAMRNFMEYRFLAISTGTGTGKTALAAILILFFLTNRPFPKVACTAPAAGQLHGALWPEVAKWQKKSALLTAMFKWTQYKVSHKKHPENWFAIARTARLQAKKDTTEAMQGLHEEHIMTLCDEASGVPDQVMSALDGAITTPGAYALLISNPTRRSGYFYRVISNPAMQVEHGGVFKVMFVSAEEAKYCDEVHIMRALTIYGKDSDFYRVKVLGLPPEADSDSLLSPEQIYAAHERGLEDEPPIHERITEKNAVKQIPDEVMISCDPARFGDDETVFYVRIGQRIVARQKHRKMDNVEIATIGYKLIKRYKPDHMIVDAIGIGSGVFDVINHLVKAHNVKYEDDVRKRLKVKMHEVHIGSEPICERVDRAGKVIESFFNLRSELAWSLRQHIDMCSIGLVNERLDEELMALKYDWDLKDKKLKLISKKEMKKELNRSPNDADSFALLFYPDLLKMSKKVIVYTPAIFALGSGNSLAAQEQRVDAGALALSNSLTDNRNVNIEDTEDETVVAMLALGGRGALKRVVPSGKRLGIRLGSSFLDAGSGRGRVGASRYSHLNSGRFG